MTAYIIAIIAFAIIGLCIVIARYMPRGECKNCLSWDNSNRNNYLWPLRGMCQLKEDRINRIITELWCNNRQKQAAHFEHEMKNIREKHITSCREGCHKWREKVVL